MSISNYSTQEFIYYSDSAQIKQDNKKRLSIIGSTDVSNKDTYELKSWLGSGGFGRVYSAVRVADSMLVAIKYVNVNRPIKLMSSYLMIPAYYYTLTKLSMSTH